jgi:glutathione synthase/RimK-type ligase-like ATP-grasp enzyme
LKYLKLFEQFINEKKPAGAPDWHDSDAPDANGRFKDLSIKDLAAWLIKTRNKDVKKISGSLTQQVVFNRKSDPKYAEKMEKTRKEVYKQLGREDLLKEALLEKGYNMDDIHDLIAFHRFNKDFRKLSAKDKEWVENDAKERGFNESADITIGGKEYKLIQKGSKITLTNTKLSADKFIFRNEKEFKAWADDQVEPIGGTQSSHFGISESVNNEDYLKKVNFILAGEKIEGLTGKNNKRIYGKINDVCLDNLFNSFYAKGDYKKDLDVDPKLPLIYYGGNSKEGLDFLKRYNVSEDVMYNLPEAMKVSGNKSDFYKMFKDTDFIPKAVYKKEDAKDLEFPIIAKPDDGHSGLGIEIFDTYEDLEKSKGKFENYSEAKDLDREFRVLLMNEDPVLVHERVSLNENEIKDKEADEQTEFTYVDQDMSKLDFMDKVNDICKKVREKLKLGLWSIDLMIDKSGDCWVAEINSASGMAADKMARVYVKVYEDFYDEKLPQEFKTHLNEEYIKPIYKINLKENADQIKRSKCCVNYQDIIDGKETIL